VNADAEADRAQQVRLFAALGAWDRALRRDELAAWRIQGTRGHIYTDGKGWVLYVSGRSARHWSAVWARLVTFCSIVQDGDDVGVVRLHGLPGPGQAEAFGFKPKHHREAVTGAWIGGNEAP